MNIKDNQDNLNCIESINDLRKVISIDDTPILNQLEFHFKKKSHNQVDEKIDLLKNYPVVHNGIISDLKKSFKNYFLNYEKASQFALIQNEEMNCLYYWEQVLVLIPYVEKLIAEFKLEGQITIEVLKDELKIKGLVDQGINLNHVRQNIYSITRILLQNSVILTYESSKSSELTLRLQIPSSSLGYFKVWFYEIDDYVFFDSSLLKYKIGNVGEILKIKMNHVFINEKLECSLQSSIPEKVINSYKDHPNGKYDIFYFPFLFRPLSIIIPEGGILVPPNSDESWRLNVAKRKKNVQKMYYLDFFSLLQK